MGEVAAGAEDSLAGGSVASLLTGRFGALFAFSPSCESTQALLEAGDPEGRVAVCDEQTAGRGRHGRAWVAPRGTALLMSILLRPPRKRRAPELSLVGGVAVALAVEHALGLSAQIKWPNDVMVNRSKVAGILAEARGEAVVLGIGLNVSLREDELPVPTATSLAVEGSEVVDREPVLRAVLRDLGRRYRTFEEHRGDAGAAGLHDAYRAACTTIGRAVRVTLPGDRVLEGDAVDVDSSGRLVVRTATGTEALAAGDVVHVR